MMDKHEGLIGRLLYSKEGEPTTPAWILPLLWEAADSIKALVEDRDETTATLRKVMEGERYERERAEKAEAERDALASGDAKAAVEMALAEIAPVLIGDAARLEADLAAARAAYLELHDFFDVEGVGQLSELYRQHCIKHTPAIAAARAEGGE